MSDFKVKGYTVSRCDGGGDDDDVTCQRKELWKQKGQQAVVAKMLAC